MSQSLRTVNVSLVESLSPRSKAHTPSYQDSLWPLPCGFCSSYPVLMLQDLEKLPYCVPNDCTAEPQPELRARKLASHHHPPLQAGLRVQRHIYSFPLVLYLPKLL